jgi:NADH-quinone oxidoreductase subunit J
MDFSALLSYEAIVPIILLVSLIGAMLATILIKNLVKAAISLSILSAILAIIMFIMEFTLAAVFELSVCAGLVTVLFISTTSLTRQKLSEELAEIRKARRKKFFVLPIILIAVTIILFFSWHTISSNMIIAAMPPEKSTVEHILWYERQVDIFGQIIIILAGVFGIVLLFKEREEK